MTGARRGWRSGSISGADYAKLPATCRGESRPCTAATNSRGCMPSAASRLLPLFRQLQPAAAEVQAIAGGTSGFEHVGMQAIDDEPSLLLCLDDSLALQNL